EERQRISRDLHDETSYQLNMAIRQVDAVIRRNPGQEKMLSPAVTYMRQSMKQIRMIINNLDDHHILEFDFRLVAEQLLQQYAVATPCLYRFFYEVKTPPNGALRISIYRILQELLQNTVKHSRATCIEVQFASQRGQLFFHYRDNG